MLFPVDSLIAIQFYSKESQELNHVAVMGPHEIDIHHHGLYLRVLRSTLKGLPFTVPSMRTLASLAPSLTTSALVRPREEPPYTSTVHYRGNI